MVHFHGKFWHVIVSIPSPRELEVKNVLEDVLQTPPPPPPSAAPHKAPLISLQVRIAAQAGIANSWTFTLQSAFTSLAVYMLAPFPT